MENLSQIILILLLSICSAHKYCNHKGVTILNQENKTLPFNGKSYDCKCVAVDDGEIPYLMCSNNYEEKVNSVIIQNQQSFKMLLNDSSEISLLQERDVQLSNDSVLQTDDPGNDSVLYTHEVARNCSFPNHDKNVSHVADTPYFNKETEDKAPESNVSNDNNLEVTNDTAKNISGSSILNIIKGVTQISNVSVKPENQKLNLPSNVSSSFSKNETKSEIDDQENGSLRGNMTEENDILLKKYEEFKEITTKNIVSSDRSSIRKTRYIVDRENVENDPNSTNVDQGQNNSMTQDIKDTPQKLRIPSEVSTIINSMELKAESSQKDLIDLNTRNEVLNETTINENTSNDLDALDQQTDNDTTIENDWLSTVIPNAESTGEKVKSFQNISQNASELSNSYDADEISYYHNQLAVTILNTTNEDGDNSSVNRTDFSLNTIVVEDDKNSSLTSDLNLTDQTSRKILPVEETTQENHPKLMMHNNVSSEAADNVSFVSDDHLNGNTTDFVNSSTGTNITIKQ